jgi:hypothetical protein
MSDAYKTEFNKIFWQCLAQGMTTVEARQYAALEMESKNERDST